MRKQDLHPRTAIINKTQKNQSRQARNQALEWLAITFPKAFDNTLSIHPLKTGIVDDILKYAENIANTAISRSKIREAVVVFTRQIDYLTCLKAREMRIDLDGNPIEQVTEEQAEKAAMKIKKRIEKNARNARKMLNNSLSASSDIKSRPTKSRLNSDTAPDPHYNPHYLERPPMFSAQNAAPTPVKSPAVIVKHKTVRQFDPEAVARLKEKLGLSRKTEANETPK